MKLSMWQLADWLKKYDPIVRIQEGEAGIRNVRFLSGDTIFSPMSVYIGRMNEYAEGEDERIICVNKKDLILLNSNDITGVFNDVLDAFEYYNGWSDTLLQKIQDGCSLEEILNDCTELFHGVLLVADSGYMVKSSVNLELLKQNHNQEELLKNRIMPLDTILAVNEDSRIRKHLKYSYVMDYPALGKPTIAKNLFSKNKHVGWVIGIVDSLEQTNIHTRQIIDEIGNLVEAWTNLNDNRLTLASSSDLFLDIMSEEYTSKDVEERKLLTIGWYPKDVKQICYIGMGDMNISIQEVLKRKIEYTLKGCFLLDQQTHFLLLRNRNLSPDYLFRQIMENLLSQTGLRMGISPDFSDIFEMKQMISLAEAAWKYGKQQEGTTTCFEECAVSYAADVLNQHIYKGFIHPAIRILRQYDAKNGTDLLRSLEAFLENDCNTMETARLLAVHRNSMQYRLRRIDELTSVKLGDFNTRLHLILSFRMMQVETNERRIEHERI